MGKSALGQRQCVGIWHGSTDLKRAVTSTISLILTMVTAVTGLRVTALLFFLATVVCGFLSVWLSADVGSLCRISRGWRS